MNLQERILHAAEATLSENPNGQTIEALAREVAQHVGQQLPAPRVAKLLREHPRRFVESGDRWRLRPAEDHFAPAEEPAPAPTTERMPLRRGCYIVFDLEATGQSPNAPATEIIQIAAERWIDGQLDDHWDSFVRPGTDITAQIARLTQITMDDLRDAPGPAEALNAFFAWAGDLPVIAHNGASYDGPLLAATCQRLGIAAPPTVANVLDTLPLARTLLPLAENHRVESLAVRFGCHRIGAHNARVDVEMLAGITSTLR